MSYDFFNRKTVVGRKVHRCEHCNRTIGKGESHFYCAGKIDGDFWAYREHDECSKAWDGLHNLRGTMYDEEMPFLACDDDIDQGEREWLHEHFPEVAGRLWPSMATPSKARQTEEARS
jgi:hypothetical protein